MFLFFISKNPTLALEDMSSFMSCGPVASFPTRRTLGSRAQRRLPGSSATRVGAGRRGCVIDARENSLARACASGTFSSASVMSVKSWHRTSRSCSPPGAGGERPRPFGDVIAVRRIPSTGSQANCWRARRSPSR